MENFFTAEQVLLLQEQDKLHRSDMVDWIQKALRPILQHTITHTSLPVIYNDTGLVTPTPPNDQPHPSFTISFTSEDYTEIINVVTAIYLNQWLECDSNARQTVNSFAAKKYVSIKERRKRASRNSDYDRVKALQRAQKTYHIMQNLQHEQATREGIGYKEFDLTRPGQKSDLNRKGGCFQSFVTLRFLDLLSNPDFTLFKLLTRKKKVMEVIGSKNNTELEYGYKAYGKIINEIQSYSDREFVVSCIQLQKMESTFRFKLAASIAEYMQDKGLPYDTKIPIDALYWWGRYAVPTSFEHTISCEPHTISNYQQAIDIVFSEDSPDIECKKLKQLLRRTLIHELLIKLDSIMSPAQLPPWSSDDYIAARRFFTEDYPVLKYCEMNLPSTNKSEFFEYIKNIYSQLLAYGELNILREGLRNPPPAHT